jgi:hypothetical protein
MISFQTETGQGSFKQTITIELPVTKRIGVLVSGGADSAILLYILAKLNLDNGSPSELIPFTVPKTDGALSFATGVINYINKSLNCQLPDTIVVGDPHLHHSKQVWSGRNEAMEKHNIDIMIYGSQKTPPKEELEVDWEYPVRPEKIHYADAKIYCPFALVDKRNTIDLYRIFDKMDLLAITHSCTEQVRGSCGKCLYCQERAWALKSINLEEPGVL